MDFDQLGEFGLIERVKKLVENFQDPSILSIGDDAAVIPGPDHTRKIIFTTDSMVEGVHFKLNYTPMKSLGWKALAVNISDIAAMGGVPKFAVVSLAVPGHWKVEDVEDLYRGLNRCGRAYTCQIVGGDTTRSNDSAFISVAMIGEVDSAKVMTRDGARDGDYIGLSRPIGGARVGLESLEKGLQPSEFRESIRHFLEPKPELKISQNLVSGLGISSLIDISDGLASEIGHLCSMSKVGCLIQAEKIPISPETKKWCLQHRCRDFEFALESGEEYALLFTVDPEKYKIWRANKKNPPLFIIGKITDQKSGMQIQNYNIRSPLISRGWDHFKK